MYVLMAVIFVVGYLCIALEHPLKLDKAASALLTAAMTWAVLVLGANEILPTLALGSNDPADSSAIVVSALRHHLGEIAEILFFLLGAMTIVELIDAHGGFKVITDRITTRRRVSLLWIIGLLTFFLSAVLDNLTTTIVMVSLLRKLVRGRPERWLYVGIVIIAANAGGAWSPIGDVTTTMLWIGGQITAQQVVVELFLPSLVCLLVPLAILSLRLKGEAPRPRLRAHVAEGGHATTDRERNAVLAMGIGALLFVPVFKTVTGLPPYMGILFGLGVLWVATEIMHRDKKPELKHPLSVIGVLHRVDTPSILFFLGILLAVSSLATAGHLGQIAVALRDGLGNIFAINYAIGLLSAVVDNVPLVAGAMKMYPTVTDGMLASATTDTEWLSQFVTDGRFWQFLAFCAGTGGSSLIIGSAAGVAAMGMERIGFFWYIKRVSLLAFLGYTAGAAVYFLMYI
ncbi:sodium:proton antiporter NhaD [Halopseudomonas bauzanensis]|uniref:Na+/H+ antiporter NhaD n=1 Tax=Halopseudomonas bauzanensis TaxID=653930 RepID=A0A1I4QGR2_9GAMM|nr:sodium:proton antiporter NhaD [Halopseudomonas bauzanensis]SES37045.1 sodium/proton antiporter, NhaD family [Halopseudomonas bauzanensis]SFM39204.1 Na+/H+ antiporter NhaD [Halopseudomonas bauzanensis]